MNQMPTLIYHDVTIVAILDLQDVADDAVCGETLREVQTRLLEPLTCFTPVPLQEVLVQVDFEGFPELVSAVRVGDALDDAAEELLCTRAVADTLVRDYVEVQITLLEDLLEKLDHLQGQDVLP